MRKLYFLAMALLLILVLAGCGGGGSEPTTVLEIFSDPTLDGDIKMDVATSAIGPPTVAANTGGVFAGIDVNAGGVSTSEYRSFLIFPLTRLPSNASIQYATISVFVDNVSFVTSPTAPIPFLVDSIDTTLFPPPIESGDFDAAFRTSRSLSFFGRDTGTFVEINVTSLLADAQARLLPDFEVRFLFDLARFQNDRTTTRGRIEIADSPTNTSRAPLLRVEYLYNPPQTGSE
jgi:hypothetical protein